jgi:ABC-type glycerol-3-phosphate transport system substrate-binding protein
MRKVFFFALAAMLIGLCCVAVLSAQSSDDKNLKAEITHWVWGDYEMKGAADFNQTYPNIKVNYVTIGSADYFKKLQTTAAAGGEMPDVANLEMTPRGALVNLDIWENLDKAPYNANRKELVPWSIPLITNAKGELVSIQIDNCVGGYTYNRALAKQYFGTDDPAKLEKIFTSWDVYLQKGKEVADKKRRQDIPVQRSERRLLGGLWNEYEGTVCQGWQTEYGFFHLARVPADRKACKSQGVG